jgi:hypothetical protein
MKRSLTCSVVVALWLSVPLTASALLADDAKEFEDAWNKRRNVAPFIRCSIDVVRIIPAGSINQDPVFPAEETTVDQSYEYLFDTKNRRLRLEVHGWSGYRSKELRLNRSIWIYTPTSMRRFKFDASGNAPKSVPAIVDLPMDGRNQFNDAAIRFSPAALAVGFSPTCGLAKPSVNANEFTFEILEDGQVELTPINEEMPVRYTAQPEHDWAVTNASLLVRSTNGRIFPNEKDIETVITCEKLAQGWYPTSWQEENGRGTETCRATWEFLEDVDETLWAEPENLRVPGIIVYTEQGRRKLDHDLSLIPPDAYRQQGSNWWLRGLLIAAGIFVTIYVVRRRRVGSV